MRIPAPSSGRTSPRPPAARIACRHEAPVAGSRSRLVAPPRNAHELVVGNEVRGGDPCAVLALQQAAEQRRDVAPPGLGRFSHTCAIAVPGWGCSGNRSTAWSNNCRSVSAQSAKNAARRPSTAGPRIRKCVSRHSDGPRASPRHSSAMPTPPVNPISSSTTITLRCVRWFTSPIRMRPKGRNQRTCTPAASSKVMRSRSIVRAP